MIHKRDDYNRRIVDLAHGNPALLEPGQQPIPNNEPVFLLRAQDVTAAATLDFWANLNEQLGSQQVQVDAAREHAKAMRAWPKKKLPDRPAGT